MNYELIPLKDLLGEKGYIRGPFGSALKRNELLDSGIPIYEQQHAINDTRDFRFFIDEDKFRELQRFTTRENDLIISCSGTVGRISIIEKNDPVGIISQALLILRPDPKKILPEFLYYFFKSEKGFNELLSASHGAVQQNIAPRYVVEKILIPSPSIDRQKEIVNVLKSLDNKIALNLETNETLEQIGHALFKSWFVDFDPVKAKAQGVRPLGIEDSTAALFPTSFEESDIGMIPKGWTVNTIGEVVDFNPKRILRKGTQAPYLDMKNMPTKGHLVDNIYDREMSSGAKFKNGDAIFARITPCLENGKTAFVDFLKDEQVGWGSTEYIIMRSRDIYSAEFSYYLARYEAFRNQAIKSMTGSSGRQRADVRALESMPWITPGKGILREFSKITRKIMNKIKSNGNQNRSLIGLRDIIIPELVFGETLVSETREQAGS